MAHRPVGKRVFARSGKHGVLGYAEFLGIVEETTGSISCMTRRLSCTRGVQKMGCVGQDLID